jgi:hypothetical protein
MPFNGSADPAASQYERCALLAAVSSYIAFDRWVLRMVNCLTLFFLGHRCNLMQTLSAFPRTDSMVCFPALDDSESMAK